MHLNFRLDHDLKGFLLALPLGINVIVLVDERETGRIVDDTLDAPGRVHKLTARSLKEGVRREKGVVLHGELDL